MIDKIEITVDVIVHATEDISKIFESLEKILDMKKEYFTIKEIDGYYENPITLMNTKIVKKQAQNFINKLLELLSTKQINGLIEEIEQRAIGSKFHLRLDKQELIKGNAVMSEKDSIKIKIHAPIYSKKDTVKIFTEIFQIAN